MKLDRPYCTSVENSLILRGVTRALIREGGGGGGEYSYIRVLSDEFLLKSVVFKFFSKEVSRAEHEYMNIHTPLPAPNKRSSYAPANTNGAIQYKCV